MFEDSLVESGGKIKTKKASTVFISAIVHIVLVTVLILVPLIYTEQIEGAKLTSFLVAPPPPPAAAPPPPPAAAIVRPVQVKIVQVDPTAMIAPTEIPKEIAHIVDAAPDPSAGAGVVGGVVGGRVGGVVGGIPGLQLNTAPPRWWSTAATAATAAATTTTAAKTSGPYSCGWRCAGRQFDI